MKMILLIVDFGWVVFSDKETSRRALAVMDVSEGDSGRGSMLNEEGGRKRKRMEGEGDQAGGAL